MYMRKDNRNNSGSTLLLVIICMLFVGIISSLILMYTSHNLKTMKEATMSSGNFYSAENVVDEVKTHLDELADQAVRIAYTKWLQQYTTTTSDQQETLFKTLFAKELKTLLENEFLPTFTTDPYQLLYNFGISNVKWLDTPRVELNTATMILSLKNISIAYTDSKGFTSEITTDFVFNVNYPGFQSNTVKGLNLPASEYIIIADEQINNSVTVSGTIKGNLYGGGYNPASTTTDKYNNKGILFDSDSNLSIYADKILSRSTIELSDRSDLNIKGINGEYDYTGTLSYTNLWAKNLLLSGISSQANPVQLILQGNCYLADDLTLDAEACRFQLKGSYYGYNSNNAYLGATDANGIRLISGTPEGSSSIVLNAKDAVLDFSNATKLWIAGKTFVSVPYRYGIGATVDNLSFSQGESISYRGLQASYLVPGDCIKGIGHNPMTEEEFIKLATEPSNYYVDISVSRRSGGIRLENYVNREKPYRIASVDYNSSTTMVYLYLNFQSTDKATQYFEDYIATKEELVNSRMSMLGSGQILFDPAILWNTGNVIGYNAGTVTYAGRKYSTSDPMIENKQIELSSKYSGLITSLDEKFAGVSMNGFLTDNIVNLSLITQNTQVETDLGYSANSANYTLITGDDVIINTNKTGIIIAKGDVFIQNSANFTGLIIARGKVTIQGNVNLKADPDNIAYLMQNNAIVAPYFSLGAESGTTGNGRTIYASDLISISYDNWRKN